MNLSLIILLTISVVTTIAYTTTLEAGMINHTYIPIVTEFHYIIESSITRFKDHLGLITIFIITIYSEDYQLSKENDYTILLAEFVYFMHNPATIITTLNSNMNITSNMMIQKQDSITITEYTDMNVQFNVDLNVSIEDDGDNDT
mgnify:CR=1 FL=1